MEGYISAVFGYLQIPGSHNELQSMHSFPGKPMVEFLLISRQRALTAQTKPHFGNPLSRADDIIGPLH